MGYYTEVTYDPPDNNSKKQRVIPLRLHPAVSTLGPPILKRYLPVVPMFELSSILAIAADMEAATVCDFNPSPALKPTCSISNNICSIIHLTVTVKLVEYIVNVTWALLF